MAIRLIAKEVALKALEAYERGGLSAQGPAPECRYRDRAGLPCAIGVALTESQAKRLDQMAFSGVSALIEDEVILVDDGGALYALQAAHDDWANLKGTGGRFLATARRIAGLEA